MKLRFVKQSEPVGKHRSDDPRALSLVQGNALLENYLEHVISPMVGLIPYETRSSFRAELKAHLEEVIEFMEADGHSFNQATDLALNDYGKAKDVSREFVESWFEKSAPGEVAKMFGYANGIAFAYFGLAQFFYIILLQVRVYLPSGAIAQLPFSPAQIRQIWPSPLPYPELTPEFLLLLGYPVIAPLLAGWLAGLKIPVNAHRAVYHAMMPILVYSFAMGAMFLPQTDGVLFALFQLAFWLPAGCLMAHVSSRYARGNFHNP